MDIVFLFVMVIGFMLIGVPIAVSLGLSSIVFMLLFSDTSLGAIAQQLFNAFAGHYTLLAIPFFILASTFMSTGGVARASSASPSPGRPFPRRPRHGRGLRLHAVRRALRLVAGHRGRHRLDLHRRHALGRLLQGLRRRRHLQRRHARHPHPAVDRHGGLRRRRRRVGRPHVSRRRHPGPSRRPHADDRHLHRRALEEPARQDWAGWGEIVAAGHDAGWGLFLIVIILGGIYGGVFTPTEAAAVAAVYSFLIANFVYRDMGPLHREGGNVSLLKRPWALLTVWVHPDTRKALFESGKVTIMLMFIIVNALLFAHVLTSERIPEAITEPALRRLHLVTFLIAVNVLLLIGGQFMEPSGLLLIVAPCCLPDRHAARH